MKSSKRSVGGLALTLALCSGIIFGVAPPEALAQIAHKNGPEFVPGEVLVQFHPGMNAAERASARAVVRAMNYESITTHTLREAGKGELELLVLPLG